MKKTIRFFNMVLRPGAATTHLNTKNEPFIGLTYGGINFEMNLIISNNEPLSISNEYACKLTTNLKNITAVLEKASNYLGLINPSSTINIEIWHPANDCNWKFKLNCEGHPIKHYDFTDLLCSVALKPTSSTEWVVFKDFISSRPTLNKIMIEGDLCSFDDFQNKFQFTQAANPTDGSHLIKMMGNLWFTLRTGESNDKITRLCRTSQENFQNKLLTETFPSDFNIMVEDQTYKCHKIVLKAQSEVLKRMLESSGTVESSIGKLDLTGEMSEHAVKAFLKFIYYSDIVEVMKDISVIFELFKAGHKYEIQGLEDVCITILKDATEEGNDVFFSCVDLAVEIYAFARCVDRFEELMDKVCILFVDKSAKFNKEILKNCIKENSGICTDMIIRRSTIKLQEEK